MSCLRVGKIKVFYFNWKSLNNEITVDKMILNHVSMSSCGISLWRKILLESLIQKVNTGMTS